MKMLKIKRFRVNQGFRKAGRIFYGLIFAVLILISAVLVISTFNIPGNYKLLIVQSGSMEPNLHLGSVVITRPTENYQKNDIITFSQSSNPKVLISHRIVGIDKNDGNTSYITKGDANQSPDLEKRLKRSVVGKVIFSVPLVGYLVSFAKSKNGLMMLIIIPSILIIVSEIINIANESKRMLEEKRKKTIKVKRIRYV